MKLPAGYQAPSVDEIQRIQSAMDEGYKDGFKSGYIHCLEDVKRFFGEDMVQDLLDKITQAGEEEIANAANNTDIGEGSEGSGVGLSMEGATNPAPQIILASANDIPHLRG